MNKKDSNSNQCALQSDQYDTITLAHGGGGKLTHQLIENVFQKHFSNQLLNMLHDGAIIQSQYERLAFSTDSYVVHPLKFPGGDIGSLAVNGTLNDLAMCGAKPVALSASFIIEEGMSLDELEEYVRSMKKSADADSVQIVTGDTKVVPRGKADRLFITTTGIGGIPKERNISPENIALGDAVILSGTIGDHGMAIMSVREGLEFELEISSDTASLCSLVETMFSVSQAIHVLRDPTRGGVASTLNELAESSQKGILIYECNIPVQSVTRAACEIFGFDPLYVANEGKLIAVVKSSEAEKILSAMKNHPLGKNAQIIGEVVDRHCKRVVMKTTIGGERVVDMISGEQLPRIC
ncbi:MAG: hydrogenase expression/formation protein HypE [Bacteroidetes bacterium]|nr:hydrogenase expression/formation protein HypE [Bacteroidota bacterium]